MGAQASIKVDFLKPDPVKDKTDFLKNVSRAVSKNHGQTATLGKYSFKIVPLEDTPYGERHEIFDEWEQFYLPEHMFMEVIGVGKTLPGHLPKAELVLMVCEDGKVYGYEDNHLHLVADCLKDLLEHSVKFPGTKQYYRGQSFEDVTVDEWEKAKESKKVREMMEEHRNMLEDLKPSYLQSLKIIEHYEQHTPAGAAGPQREPVPVL